MRRRGQIIQLISYVGIIIALFVFNYINGLSQSVDNAQEILKQEMEQFIVSDQANLEELYEEIYNLDMTSNIRYSIFDEVGNVLLDSRNEVSFDEVYVTTILSAEYLEYIQTTHHIDGESYIVIFTKAELNNELVIVELSQKHDYNISVLQLSIYLVAIIATLAIYFVGKRRETIEYDKNIKKLDKKVENIVNGICEIEELKTDFDVSINKLTSYIQVLNHKYQNRKVQLEAILGSLQSAILAIKNNGDVIFSNNKFTEIYGIDLNGLKTNVYHNIYDNHILDIIKEVQEKDYVELRHIEQPNSNLFNYRAIKIMYNQKEIGILIHIEDVTKVAKLDKLKQDFVSNVTHELKTPLTSIQGFAETLLSVEPGSEHFKKFLYIINDEADRLNQLINDILVLSELENTAISNTGLIDLNRIAREVINLSEIHRKKGVNVFLEAERNYLIRFERNKLKQLLINLITNALKYTEQGEVKVSISEDIKSIILTITDTGIGIPKEEQGRIFDRFYRVDKDRSRDTGGTGLGLSIVKNIVEKSNCNLLFDSDPGVGTTFKLVFPKEIL